MRVFTITAGPECHPVAVLAAASAAEAGAVAREMLGVEDDEGEPMSLSARAAMDDEAAILESSFAAGIDLAECLVLLPREEETD
jgi:phosphoribosylcarboxyaminoimidazole (NCAIR) mutase